MSLKKDMGSISRDKWSYMTGGKSSDNKAAYMYLLTPHGIEEKSKITARFLKRKMAECVISGFWGVLLGIAV